MTKQLRNVLFVHIPGGVYAENPLNFTDCITIVYDLARDLAPYVIEWMGFNAPIILKTDCYFPFSLHLRVLFTNHTLHYTLTHEIILHMKLLPLIHQIKGNT